LIDAGVYLVRVVNGLNRLIIFATTQFDCPLAEVNPR
jgi:hypothetical protein